MSEKGLTSEQAKESRKTRKTGMMRSLDRLIKVIGFALVPIGLALFYNGYIINKNSFADTIPAVVAALVGMIPEGLYLLTNIVLLTGIELFAVAFQFNQATLSTLSTLIMELVGLMVLYYVSKPMDRKHWILWGSMGVGMIVAIFQFNDIFEISPVNFQSGLVTVVFLLPVPTVIQFFEKLFELGGIGLDRCTEKLKFSKNKKEITTKQ